MSLHTKVCLVVLGTFIAFLLVQNECRKLEGYKFPVYTTAFCPRIQTEWTERSSALKCNKSNGYMCIPNESIDQLLEFCYREPVVRIQKGICLYLIKSVSLVQSYNCSRFEQECPDHSFFSSEFFKHPACISIGNRCFLAEQSCKSITPPHIQSTTQQFESVNKWNGSTATHPQQSSEHPQLENVPINDNDDALLVPILLGIFIPLCFLSLLCGYYIKRKYQICETNGDTDVEGQEQEQLLEESHYEAKNIVQFKDVNESEKEKEDESHSKESPLDRAILKQWQEDNSKFVSTRACKEVEKIIKSKNLVVVTGNSGSGKTAIIQHIALCYRSQGWTVKPVYSVKEITDTYSSVNESQSRFLFVFNDPIGNESFDEIAYTSWKVNDERLKTCFKNTKMLLSSRKHILLDNRVRGMLNDKSCIIDLSDDKHKLNNEEKENILNSYSSNSNLLKDDINEIIKTEEYFPLLCKLYFSDKNKRTVGPRFFKEPFEVCQEQIRNFRNKYPENYCALVLLVLCNNQLCFEDIQRNDRLRENFELALKLCEITNTALHTIGDTLKNLEGFFVKKIGNTYHFYHDFVMEVTAYVFGTEYPRETIQYADIGFLRRRVNLKSSNDNRKEVVDQFTICLNDKYVCDLGERLFNEIFGDRLLDVVLNPCTKNEKLAQFFIQNLEDSPDKLSKLLAKKQLHQDFRNQEDNQTVKQPFGSKLEFLYYEDNVSILSAIIVFCHTDLSKHCLEALQQTQTSVIGNYLFSAVCCNGSIALFNVFPKEQIKEFLMENRGQCSPIHIVSQFCNHEILHDLILVKNDVNFKTEYGCTPLMLAAFNTDVSEEENKESRIQSIDLTVKLLLEHGADIHSCHSIFGSPLHIACAKGNDDTVQLLLTKDANVNLCNCANRTPLYEAIKNGYDRIVDFLLNNEANFNLCDKDGKTPLHVAIENGYEKIVRLLLNKGANVDSCDCEEKSPLYKAIENGHERIVELLLNKGANFNSCDDEKKTPLHTAVEIGHERIVQFLLQKGSTVNSCDELEKTPLHKASENGHESIVQLLLNKAANVNSCDQYEETPLHKASENGHENIVKLLLGKEAKVDSCDQYKETPLHKASKNGHESIVQLLLNKGANVNSCDQYEETPLHKASENGHESIVKLLLDKKANVNSCDVKRKIPLHKASENGHERIVQLLLDKEDNVISSDVRQKNLLNKGSETGYKRIAQLIFKKECNVNACDVMKKSPLRYACEKEHESTVQLLLNKGANIDSSDLYKETSLHEASKKGHKSIVQILLRNEADVNACDQYGDTPLHKACKYGHESIVQLLLSKEADINLCNKFKETPLHKAGENGYEKIVELLYK